MLTFSWCSRLAVKYQFLASGGDDTEHELQVDSFNAVQEQNDYEVRMNVPVHCIFHEELTGNKLDPMVAS